MKILYIVESCAPYGANKCLIDIIDFLIRKGDRPFVVGSEYGTLSERLSEMGVPFKLLGHKLSIYPRAKTIKDKVLFLPKLFAFRIINFVALIKLIRICLYYKPDIIHTNIGPTALGYWASKLLNIKHVWHLREYQDLDFDMNFFPNKYVFKSLINKADKVICVTSKISNHFSDPLNSDVIYDGVLEPSENKISSNKKPYFLFVGRLEPTKGIEEVLDSFVHYCELGYLNYELLIAGSGQESYLQNLKHKVECGQFKNKIKFLGFRNDINELMRSAKALVVASKCEGFGLITAEAMFNGCIVIGRNSGGTSEILTNNSGRDFGILFENNKELTKCFIEVSEMTDEELLIMASNAHDEAVKKYRLKKQHEKLYSIYESLISYQVGK
ncbi:glycosyltransferase family 4 protein [Plesiomonas shigelloides]|uniref:glycosyltransferase family 4 protein n=1 Tax=Plesiomonas shigelloides TaxID=703 RepID=UPI0022A83C3D|nr:glycosyltransferase family 4 protein [Plesiomonas shigelloides]